MTSISQNKSIDFLMKIEKVEDFKNEFTVEFISATNDCKPSSEMKEIMNEHASINIDKASDVLSSREKEVIISLCNGKRAKEIANELSLSIHTIHTYVKNIYSKLNISSMIQIGVMGARLGIV